MNKKDVIWLFNANNITTNLFAHEDLSCHAIHLTVVLCRDQEVAFDLTVQVSDPRLGLQTGIVKEIQATSPKAWWILTVSIEVDNVSW